MSEPTPVYINAGHKLTRCVRCGTIFPTGLEKEHEATRRDQHPAKKEIERRRPRGRAASFFFALALALIPIGARADTLSLDSGALTLRVIGIDHVVVGTTFDASGPDVKLHLTSGIGVSPGCQPCLAGLPFQTV